MMKKYILFLCIFALLALCGCEEDKIHSTSSENTTETTLSDAFLNTLPSTITEPVISNSSQDVPDEYDAVLSDYRKIIEYRLSDYFSQNYINGVDIGISNELMQDFKSDTVSNWSYMLIEMPSGMKNAKNSDFGYILYDMNHDAVPELFWVRSDHTILAVFTIINGNAKLLDVYWPRYSAFVNESENFVTRNSGGAGYIVYTVYEISAEGTLKQRMRFGQERASDYDVYDDSYYEEVDGNKVIISEKTFEEYLQDHPDENGTNWLSMEILLP